MNYYKHHIGDYIKKTLGLSQGQHGAYFLLIQAGYTSENGIAADEVYDVAKARTPAERKNTDKVLAKYFQLRDGRYYQNRMNEEVAAYHAKAETNRENGVKGGRPAKPRENPQITQTVTQQEPRPEPEANPQETLAISHKPLETKPPIKQRLSSDDTCVRAGDLGAAALRNLQPGASPAHRIAGCDETPAALLAAVMHENGLRGNAFHPLIVEWARERVTVERLKAAIAKARQRPGKERGAFGPEYLDPILHDESKPAAQVTQERVAEDAAKRIAATEATLNQQREDAARASGPPGGSIAAFVAGALAKAAPT